MVEMTNCKICLIVEMAGIEPASERFDPRISTSVADFLSRDGQATPANLKTASRSDPKVLFCTAHGRLHSIPALYRLAPPPAGIRGGQTSPLLAI